MFGFVVTNNDILDSSDKKTYDAYYCGLCHALKKNCGELSRLTLNYDLTFLALFLNSLYNEKTNEIKSGCTLHPIRKHGYFENEIFDYCAYMNLALSYYKMRDDWNDDKNVFSLGLSSLFEKKVHEINKKYPCQLKAIENCLGRLDEVEKKNILNPDIPATIFGELMGELFNYRKDKKAQEFGIALGKFIYTADACIDLKKDLKRKSYNPMLLTSSRRFREILNVLIGDCTKIYNEMNITRNKAIIDNILYSGIWSKFELYCKRNARKGNPSK